MPLLIMDEQREPDEQQCGASREHHQKPQRAALLRVPRNARDLLMDLAGSQQQLRAGLIHRMENRETEKPDCFEALQCLFQSIGVLPQPRFQRSSGKRWENNPKSRQCPFVF